MLIISSVITLFSICGAVFNARGSIWGFYIWLPANLSWVVYDICIKEYPQAVLFVVYSIISAFGIYQWRKHKVGR